MANYFYIYSVRFKLTSMKVLSSVILKGYKKEDIKCQFSFEFYSLRHSARRKDPAKW